MLEWKSFECLAGFSGIWVWQIDSNGRYTYCSDSANELLGYDRSEVVGSLFSDFLSGDTLKKEFQKNIVGKKLFANTEFLHQKKDGTVIRLLTTGIPVLDQQGYLLGYHGMSLDITEPQREAEIRKTSKARLDALLELFHRANLSSLNDICNCALQHMIELSGSTVGYLYITDSVDGTMIRLGEELEKCKISLSAPYYLSKGLWSECFRTGRPLIVNDYPSYSDKSGLPEGHVPIRRLLSLPIFVSDNIVAIAGVSNKEKAYNELDLLQLTLFTGIAWPLINRVRAEHPLMGSEDKDNHVIEMARQGMFVLDKEDNFVFVNNKFANIYGFNVDQTIGRNVSEVFANYPTKVNDIMNRRKRGISENYEWKYVRQDGSNIWVHISAIALHARDTYEGTLGIVTDITERKNHELHLLAEKEKLAANLKNKIRKLQIKNQKDLSLVKDMALKYLGIEQLGIFSETMSNILSQAGSYNRERSMPVLIEGETGTGKEIVAKIIHFGQIDNLTPFVGLNCAALPPQLFESELFGYEAGSFTGSLSKGQQGKLDLAEGGTLFLDEIAELPMDLQAKLLRVLEEKEFYRVGGLKKVKTNVRLICATNKALEKMVEQGKFRRDLYYRIRVGFIRIPPLRERKDEIMPLANMFLERYSREKGKKFVCVGDTAGDLLLSYNWPGNVRELKNMMELIVFRYDDVEVQPWHLIDLYPSMLGKTLQEKHQSQSRSVVDPKHTLDDAICKVVLEALQINNGNKTKTAQYLGISKATLYNYLKKSKID